MSDTATGVKSFSQTLTKEEAKEIGETEEKQAEEQESEEQKEESKETSEEQSEEKSEETEASRKVPLSELLKERDKRKDLERRLEALESQQTQQSTEPAEVPDKDIDPGGYADHQVGNLANNVNNRLLMMSEVSARNSHDDFDEHYQAGIDYLKEKSNQHLVSGYLADSHPAEKVYQLGKKLHFEKEYGKTPEEQREKIREEERAKIRKELEDESKQRKKAKDKQPTDILSKRAASGDAVPEFRPKSFGAAQRDVMSRRVR